MEQAAPFIRIALYILAGWLAGRGLPPEAVTIITSDPAVLAIASEALAAVVAGVALLWWRIAKRFGWST